VGLLDDPQSPVHKLVLQYKVALGLLPERGTGPNVYYVPPFNPPRRANYGKGLVHDPRIPLGYLKYLFGPAVEDVLRRLEAELARAQAGQTSELLQLLIGRDADVRYRIVDPDTMERFENQPTHQLVQLGVMRR
jgi:nitrate reductase beta subunit